MSNRRPNQRGGVMDKGKLKFTRLAVPFQLRSNHHRRGGRMLRRWVARVDGGVVRVMAGFEPAGKRGRFIWHVSVSVAKFPGVGEPPIRLPTDREFEAACELVPTVGKWEEERGEGMIRHAFEARS
jgi:hypothetical protein